MKNTHYGFLLLSIAWVAPGHAQGPPVPSGTGLYVTPSSGAYALLANAADQMLGDIQARVPGVKSVVIYDQGTFGNLPYYATAVEQVKSALGGLCNVNRPRLEALAPTLDLGTAASGLAALIGVTLPTYSINGQAVTTIDTTALVGVFATEVQTQSIAVINPLYLLPAKAADGMNCSNYAQSESIATLWAFAATEARTIAASPGAGNDPAKSALAQFQKLSDVYLAADKGLPLVSKMLIVETLLYSVTDLAHTAVIDMKLDGAGIDSTTRAILWWRTTKISSNILAHYWILKIAKDGTKLSLTLDKPGYANFMMKNVDQSKFATSVKPKGPINPVP